MVMKKGECIEILLRKRMQVGFPELCRAFEQISPIDSEDAQRAYWQSVPVANLRRFTEIILNKGKPSLSPISAQHESSMPSTIEELEIDDYEEDELDDFLAEDIEEDEDIEEEDVEYDDVDYFELEKPNIDLFDVNITGEDNDDYFEL
jgi:hypothetical protein